ncbi:AAA family ATPase [Deferribacteres bacterium DY0037]
MLSKLLINNFRIFKGSTDNNGDTVPIAIKLGSGITVFAGKNATGKSTLLAMIGNCCELKKTFGKPLVVNSQFKTEFSEIFKGDPEYDLSGSNRFTVFLYTLEKDVTHIDYRSVRVSWQNDKTRFRVIPEIRKFPKSSSSTKMVYPVLYLGMSRLFPLGESKDEDIKHEIVSLSAQEKEWFIEKYKEVLYLGDQIESVASIGISETKKKKVIAVSTDKYSFLSNSAGQDNLGQILLAILSFQRLKDNYSDYKGGALLIDEFETTLHPVAQKALYKLLRKECKNLNLQVMFTTHSETLLKDICSREIANNSVSKINFTELHYLTNSNRRLDILNNPSYEVVVNDLNAEVANSRIKQIKIYSEDAEARWVTKNLLSDYLDRFEFLDVSLGCSQIIQLYKADIDYFNKHLIILDGDAISDLTSLPEPLQKNIILLPSSQRPETFIYDYLINLDCDHPLWSKGLNCGLTHEYLTRKGPNSYTDEKEREKAKKWFQDNRILFEQIDLFGEFWIKDNPEAYKMFIDKFISAFNYLARINFVPRIEV